MFNNSLYPFAAVVGQEQAKQALLIALVSRKAGGLLLGGRKGTAKTTLVRSCRDLLGNQKLLDLPLNITEDMLFGSIDLEAAVSLGQRRFAPGLLARADGNILYIDEANLLRQELLTAALDACAEGENRVERDGISCVHETRFTVIATMNPQEGTLPQHLLDRFGMYADVQESTDIGQRMEIIRRRLQYEADPSAFRRQFARETDGLAEQVAEARRLLPQVEISDAMMILAANMCAQALCAGHRAEIFLLEAARALAALAGRTYLLPKDMEQAAVYVLAHRMRRQPEHQQEPGQNHEQQENRDNSGSNDEGKDGEETDETAESGGQDNYTAEGHSDSTDNADTSESSDSQGKKENGQHEAPEKIDGADKSFHMPKIAVDLGKDRAVRRGSGKRSLTRTDLKQGRYVRSELPKDAVNDLAFDATIRAAAPFQRLRPGNGCALNIMPEDMRQKVREKRIGSTFLFAVDASGSMGARERMRAVKGAIFYMLQEAYQKRDRVGMIAFRREQAEVLLPITRSVDLAQKRLQQMPTGGRTPLAEGLAQALLTLSLQGSREKDMEPVLILVTDGRANACAGEQNPVENALKIAEKIRKAGIISVVIDTENDFIRLGIARKLADAMGASYYTLNRLSRENIIRIVKNLGE